MENVSNISSEQELLKLRQEDKISEDEYQQLLEAMRKSPPGEKGVSKPEVCPVKTELRAFRKRVFITGMIICVIAVPLGFVLKIPLVWMLGIIGIIIIPVKMYLLKK